jgi:hypothetical protein
VVESLGGVTSLPSLKKYFFTIFDLTGFLYYGTIIVIIGAVALKEKKY